MKALSNTRRRFFVGLFILAGIGGFATQGQSAVAQGDKQCWYEVGTTPACDYCFDGCMGSGYVCCTIVVDQAD
jgi:hypothetical protein